MSSYLFVGGPLDGQSRDVAFTVPIVTIPTAAPSPNPVDDATTFWIDERGFPRSSIDPVMTTHTYRYEDGRYEYEGARG